MRKKKKDTGTTDKDTTKIDHVRGVYGKRLEDPVLGSYFELPKRNSHFPNIKLDTSFSYVTTKAVIYKLVLKLHVFL